MRLHREAVTNVTKTRFELVTEIINDFAGVTNVTGVTRVLDKPLRRSFPRFQIAQKVIGRTFLLKPLSKFMVTAGDMVTPAELLSISVTIVKEGFGDIGDKPPVAEGVL